MALDSRCSFDGSWPEIEALLGGAASIDALARSTGALVRPRKVRDGSQILRLALGYAATGRSLRTTAAWSELGLGIALSDVALLGRLREAGEFLAVLTSRLLAIAAAGAAPAGSWSGPSVRLVDGSVFAGPGAKGGQHRLHATYDPMGGIFTAIDVTPTKQGESLTTAAIEPGAIAVADRNYAKTQAFRLLNDEGAFFVVRTGMRSTRMIDPVAGERLTAEAVLAALGEAETSELAIEMVEARPKKGAPGPVKARLLILRASEAVAKREKARIRRSSTRHGATPTKDTQALAEVVMLVTNLPVSAWPIEKVASLYRLRWQVELAFKTLKSTFAMRDTPAKDPKLARVWILANLAAALLADILSRALERAIPPSGTQTADA